MDDPYRLARFVVAQNQGHSYADALVEIRAGRKSSHWIWYVFPQLAGLASSATSREYAISSLDEARSFLRHPVLGPRLCEITAAANAHREKSARDIFGIDDVKFHSSMTLFLRASPADAPFREALAHFFADEPDARTDALLAGDAPTPR